jgi:hypothetical protein
VSYGPDYREVYTKEEMEKFNIRMIAAAIIMSVGVERGIAVREAFVLSKEVEAQTSLTIEDRLKAQEKHARGY